MTEHTIQQDSTEETRVEPFIVNGIYNVYGIVVYAIDEDTLVPLMADTDSQTTYGRDTPAQIECVPGDDEWVDRMARLRRNALQDLAMLRASQRDLLQWKAGIGEALKEEAERRDWCGEYDDFADEWDLPRRSRNYDVTMTVRVTAADEDEAKELVSGEVNLYGYGSHEWLVENPDYSVSEA